MFPLKNHPGRWIAATMAFVTLALLLWFRSLALENNEVAFLDHKPPAEWILYPKSPDGAVHRMADMETAFRRSFVVENVPGRATLNIRGMKRWTVMINGITAPVPPGTGENWKEVTTLDASSVLRPGTNEIVAVVFNTNGPPALWLALDIGSREIISDSGWEASFAGAAWQKAEPATAPTSFEGGNVLGGGERVTVAFRESLEMLALFAVIAAGVFFGGQWWFARAKNDSGAMEPFLRRKFTLVVIGIPAILWLALFINNMGLLPSDMGFDSLHHLDYIDYVRNQWRLPLANEGWQTYQPPLYYLVCAVLLTLSNLTGLGGNTVELVRLFGMAIGIAHFALIFLSLRLLFPGRIGVQLFGLLLAAFVPENLYLSQFVTNESLSATLVTASIYVCLRILKQDTNSPWLFAALGLCLGAALLTKVTGVIAAPIIGAALIGRFVVKRERCPRVWMRTLGLAIAVALLVCGWHYLRVWMRFGRVLVGNWDVVTGFEWWMERGFGTSGYFFHFGNFLGYPWFSGFDSFGDGLYTTLWGDGLWAGEVFKIYRPPWNHPLMAAGFVLALWPTALILAGSARALWRLIRQPDLSWFLVAGVGFGTFAALIYMMLRVPNYGEAKAFYGMIALLPMCAFAALGWEFLLRRGKIAVALGAVIFGTWAMTSYASFWIRRWDVKTQIVIAHNLEAHGARALANEHYEQALRRDPSNIDARKRLAKNSFDKKDFAETKQLITSILAEQPDDGESHSIMAAILSAQNQPDAAIAEAQKSVQLDPAQPIGYVLLGDLLLGQHRDREAVAAWRDGLRADPLNPVLHFKLGQMSLGSGAEADAFAHFRLAAQLKPEWADARDQYGLSLLGRKKFDDALEQFHAAAQLSPKIASFHYNLAVALGAVGRPADAIVEYRKAIELNPDYPQALNNLAWMLATSADPQLRNGAEAVRMAQHACELSGRKKAVFIATLAAAYAEAGRFNDAAAAANEAIALAREANDAGMVSTNEKLVELYKSNQPFHQK